MGFNVAIDGPAGAGKSTVARAAAERLGMIYVDTGAMYRAMALFMLRKGVDLSDEEAVSLSCKQVRITIRYEGGRQVVLLNGENVNRLIRTEEVGNATSVVSAIPAVRKKLVELQQALAAGQDCLMDGRDIGTCVLPKAQLKIYLTADSAVRAKRRYDELTAKGRKCDLKQIQADIEERDYRDMHRAVSPLSRARDAVLLDTSRLNQEEVIAQVTELCRKRREGLL